MSGGLAALLRRLRGPADLEALKARLRRQPLATLRLLHAWLGEYIARRRMELAPPEADGKSDAHQ